MIYFNDLDGPKCRYLLYIENSFLRVEVCNQTIPFLVLELFGLRGVTVITNRLKVFDYDLIQFFIL